MENAWSLMTRSFMKVAISSLFLFLFEFPFCHHFVISFSLLVWCREDVPGDRIVLLLDVWHPDLAQCEIDALNYCVPALPAKEVNTEQPSDDDRSSE
jgi:hypothetical protein